MDNPFYKPACPYLLFPRFTRPIDRFPSDAPLDACRETTDFPY